MGCLQLKKTCVCIVKKNKSEAKRLTRTRSVAGGVGKRRCDDGFKAVNIVKKARNSKQY